VRATLSTLTLGDLRVFNDTILLVEDPNETSGKSGRNPLAGHWDTFRFWHAEVSFWRDVYVRTVAALAAAAVIYLVAALAGLVSTAPLAVVGIVTVVATTPFLLYWVVDMIAHRKDLRMSKDWSLTPPRNVGEVRIRKVYIKALPIELMWIVGVVLVLIAAIAR